MFKQRLKARREEMGLTQEELANKLGCKQQTVAAWETGMNKPNTDALTILADALDCSADYLLGRR